MSLYHKINGPFKRDMSIKTKPLIIGEWSIPEFKLLKDIDWVSYEKIDGMNIRVMYDGEQVTFGGRTEKAMIPAHLLEMLGKTFTIERMKGVFPDREEGQTVTIFGEGTGYKIQKGCKYFNNEKIVSLIMFDAKIGHWYLKDTDVNIIANSFGLTTAPFVKIGTLDELFEIVRNGLKSNYGDFNAEGIVAKPALNLFDRGGRRIITKIKHKDFFNI